MGESLDMELSHTIILVTRENVDDLFKFNIEPISLSVNRLMKQRLLEAGQKERLRTYMLHEKVEDSRIVLGILFESLAQIQLQKEVDLNLVRMVKGSTQRGNDKWKSRPSSDTSSQATSSHILFKPKDTDEYANSHPSDIKEGVFYVPLSQNEVAFDSFLLVDKVLYLFQMTIASRHEIKEGIMESLEHPTLMGAEWHFIFVTPSGTPIVCSQANVAKMGEFRDKASLFVAEIDFHKLEPPKAATPPT